MMPASPDLGELNYTITKEIFKTEIQKPFSGTLPLSQLLLHLILTTACL